MLSIKLEGTNLYFNGYKLDINGNSVIKLQFPNQRSFSIQTNGKLPETNRLSCKSIFSLNKKNLEDIKNEVVNYIQKYGSTKQKTSFKID